MASPVVLKGNEKAKRSDFLKENQVCDPEGTIVICGRCEVPGDSSFDTSQCLPFCSS
jgi:hypothetical protein